MRTKEEIGLDTKLREIGYWSVSLFFSVSLPPSLSFPSLALSVSLPPPPFPRTLARAHKLTPRTHEHTLKHTHMGAQRLQPDVCYMYFRMPCLYVCTCMRMHITYSAYNQMYAICN